jgi:uncharacterized repeat protein (TIGR03803 family)
MLNLRGASLPLVAAFFCLPFTQAQTFTVLHTFESAGGSNPQASVIEDSAGNLYGTAENGGAYNWGTAFKLTPKGKFTVLHSFGATATDGLWPASPLLLDSGNLYGTTVLGGDYCDTSGSSPVSCGTVYKINANGKESIVHDFVGSEPTIDGANPFAGLIADSKGNLYGTTYIGYNGLNQAGTAFELTPSGKETILHTFPGDGDGWAPYGPLVMDSSGTLWGTTYSGGENSCLLEGCGTVFKLTKTTTGWTEKVTFTFDGANGSHPYAGLTWDPRRHVFYGTTQFGGANTSDCYDEGDPVGCGVLFELDSTGTKETILHSFTGKADGSLPYAGLVLDPFGDLYGTTTFGGAGYGTVFVQPVIGSLITLHTFTGGADGAYPWAPLVLNMKKLTLYGTTYQGGDPTCDSGIGCGTLFSITP